MANVRLLGSGPAKTGGYGGCFQCSRHGVGQAAGQIAKHKGCRVTGIAGGKEKHVFVVNELGFDACIDYKNESVCECLKQHCQRHQCVYFDNVAGEILDDMLASST